MLIPLGLIFYMGILEEKNYIYSLVGKVLGTGRQEGFPKLHLKNFIHSTNSLTQQTYILNAYYPHAWDCCSWKRIKIEVNREERLGLELKTKQTKNFQERQNEVPILPPMKGWGLGTGIVSLEPSVAPVRELELHGWGICRQRSLRQQAHMQKSPRPCLTSAVYVSSFIFLYFCKKESAELKCNESPRAGQASQGAPEWTTLLFLFISNK